MNIYTFFARQINKFYAFPSFSSISKMFGIFRHVKAALNASSSLSSSSSSSPSSANQSQKSDRCFSTSGLPLSPEYLSCSDSPILVDKRTHLSSPVASLIDSLQTNFTPNALSINTLKNTPIRSASTPGNLSPIVSKVKPADTEETLDNSRNLTKLKKTTTTSQPKDNNNNPKIETKTSTPNSIMARTKNLHRGPTDRRQPGIEPACFSSSSTTSSTPKRVRSKRPRKPSSYPRQKTKQTSTPPTSNIGSKNLSSAAGPGTNTMTKPKIIVKPFRNKRTQQEIYNAFRPILPKSTPIRTPIKKGTQPPQLDGPKTAPLLTTLPGKISPQRKITQFFNKRPLSSPESDSLPFHKLQKQDDNTLTPVLQQNTLTDRAFTNAQPAISLYIDHPDPHPTGFHTPGPQDRHPNKTPPRIINESTAKPSQSPPVISRRQLEMNTSYQTIDKLNISLANVYMKKATLEDNWKGKATGPSLSPNQYYHKLSLLNDKVTELVHQRQEQYAKIKSLNLTSVSPNQNEVTPHPASPPNPINITLQTPLGFNSELATSHLTLLSNSIQEGCSLPDLVTLRNPSHTPKLSSPNTEPTSSQNRTPHPGYFTKAPEAAPPSQPAHPDPNSSMNSDDNQGIELGSKNLRITYSNPTHNHLANSQVPKYFYSPIPELQSHEIFSLLEPMPGNLFEEEPHRDSTENSSANPPNAEEEDFDLYGDLPPQPPNEDQVKELQKIQAEDRARVQAAIKAKGGLFDKRPINSNRPVPKRKGVDVVQINETVKIDEINIAPAKAPRPDEKTLRRITPAELMPPPSHLPDGMESLHYVQTMSNVQQQNIHFLVLMRPSDNPRGEWIFPSKETLNEMFDKIIDDIDDDDVIKVALSCHVDPEGIATIALSTIDMPIFNQVRNGIAAYTGCTGYVFSTHNKQTFVEKNAATIYIPARHKRYLPKRFWRFFFKEYPALRSTYTVIDQITFTENDPNKPHVNRIGDTILVVGGEDFLAKLAEFDEDHIFTMNAYWRLTIKGGQRKSASGNFGQIENIAASVKRLVVQNGAKETADNSRAQSFTN